MADRCTSALPAAVVSPRANCKCCGTVSPIFGVVDFNKMCRLEAEGQTLPYCGTPIYYYRCPGCSFLFTTAFDHFTRADFSEHIYNDAYVLVDGEYLDVRPRRHARGAAQAFAEHRSVQFLDYGGGTGALERELRASGFTDVTTYDPFVPAHARRPQRKFDCVFCFEVMEHSPTPLQILADIDSFLGPDGIIIFSTMFQPPQLSKLGMEWWYIAPRNGHISIFTEAAMMKLLSPMGMRMASYGDDLHFAVRNIPPFVAHLFAK